MSNFKVMQANLPNYPNGKFLLVYMYQQKRLKKVRLGQVKYQPGATLYPKFLLVLEVSACWEVSAFPLCSGNYYLNFLNRNVEESNESAFLTSLPC